VYLWKAVSSKQIRATEMEKREEKPGEKATDQTADVREKLILPSLQGKLTPLM